MPHYGLLGNYVSDDPAKDIRGQSLYGVNDEKLGKITDVIFDHTTGDIIYVVVDTGGWLTSKEFIVPADFLQRSTKHEDDFACALTKRQIESFPPYNEKDLQSREQWVHYEQRYRHGSNQPAPGTRPDRGSRWDNFQNLVRERREAVILECEACAEEDKEELKRAS